MTYTVISGLSVGVFGVNTVFSHSWPQSLLMSEFRYKKGLNTYFTSARKARKGTVLRILKLLTKICQCYYCLHTCTIS